MKPFTVLTLNWNGKEVLQPMVSSLAEPVERLGGELLVFDNGSSDGSDIEAEKEWGDRSWFRMVRSPENLGFAAGANRAVLKDIDSRIVVLANSDTAFRPGSLETLLRKADEHPEAGMLGPRLLWPDGTLQRSLRDFPFPGKLLRENIPFLKGKAAINDPHCRERYVDWFVGAVMVFRRDIFLSAGGFDEDFFFYHEETELQYRLFRNGYRSLFVPEAEVIHVEGASARKKFGSETYTKYIHAKVKFLEKHGYRGSRTLFRLFMGLLQVCRFTAGLLVPRLGRKDVRFTAFYCRRALGELCRSNGRKNR
ncbi:hypothetical protein CSA37_12225 [Candidatus Fermentibacteria bacterium]|nr:MAG: hypothetical protein CSA37_12225 [Candidatus Fermentibacteria bacterium]